MNKAGNSKDCKVKVDDVAIIWGDEKNRNQWKLGIVQEFMKGKDEVIRGAKLRAGKSYLERPVQHLWFESWSFGVETTMRRCSRRRIKNEEHSWKWR